ncbi:hypothetical protein RHSIM_RhsimUnG0079000 [Rhododendron simsii]|uniref:Uncharacterized protein n=1 Tax=Rhododendron simsii TaxID=118357 RepID=A0A834FVW1_RHOSS|nr:hypothetical protein RHSIM_RhsimUnG0079000 [Rhododendron simsii]
MLSILLVFVGVQLYRATIATSGDLVPTTKEFFANKCMDIFIRQGNESEVALEDQYVELGLLPKVLHIPGRLKSSGKA